MKKLMKVKSLRKKLKEDKDNEKLKNKKSFLKDLIMYLQFKEQYVNNK